MLWLIRELISVDQSFVITLTSYMIWLTCHIFHRSIQTWMVLIHHFSTLFLVTSFSTYSRQSFRDNLSSMPIDPGFRWQRMSSKQTARWPPWPWPDEFNTTNCTQESSPNNGYPRRGRCFIYNVRLQVASFTLKYCTLDFWFVFSGLISYLTGS